MAGLASGAADTVKQRKCIRDKIMDGMDETQAKEACGYKESDAPIIEPRTGKKKGGMVTKKRVGKKAGGMVHAASKNHKFSY